MKQRFRVEVKSLDEQGVFEGILSAYNVVDQGGDIVEPGAFTKTLTERGNQIPLLWQHKADSPIGMLTLSDTPEALLVKGQLLLELPTAQQAYTLMKAGIVKGLSIGYETIKKAMDGNVRRLKELKLYEGSLVTFPMNEAALVTSLKRSAGQHKDGFTDELIERQLCDANYQMMAALMDALYSILYEQALSPADKQAAAEETIQQFSDAYLAWMPQYFAMCEEMDKQAVTGEQKAGRTISSATRASLTKACEHMKAARMSHKSALDLISALLEDEADDPATSDPEAASKSEPVNHSAIVTLLSELKGLLNGKLGS